MEEIKEKCKTDEEILKNGHFIISDHLKRIFPVNIEKQVDTNFRTFKEKFFLY